MFSNVFKQKKDKTNTTSTDMSITQNNDSIMISRMTTKSNN